MGIVDAWNASVRTRGTAADRGRRVRRSVRRVGDNAPYQRGRGLRVILVKCILSKIIATPDVLFGRIHINYGRPYRSACVR